MIPQQVATIAQERIAGKTYQEIADQYGCNKSTIFRALKKEEMQEILEIGMQQQIALVPKAIDVLNYTLTQTDDKALRYKASQDVLKNTGLSPSMAPSIAITNILNLHSQDIHLEAAAAKALKHLGLEIPSNVIDVDPSPVSEATP